MGAIPPIPQSLASKVYGWVVSMVLIIIFWVYSLYHLAKIMIKYQDNPVYQDLSLTWWCSGVLTIFVGCVYIVISFFFWLQRKRKWSKHCMYVSKLKRQNLMLKRHLSRFVQKNLENY